ncbi:MAG: MFS transporter [Cyanobacteria bacterium J06576_12]
MVNAYLLPIACLVLPAGTLGDRYGRKRVFTAGLAIFIVASALVGLSLNGQIAIAGRLLQGIGAAAILPTSLAILSEAYPNPKARAKAIGIWSGVSGLALIIGPALGGILVDTFGWRSIFFLNIPLGALTLWLTHKSVSTRRQHRFSRLSLKLLRQRSLITVVVTNALLFFTLVSLLFLFSLFLQQVQGYSAIETGLRFLPLNIAFILASLLSGHFAARIGKRSAITAGFVIAGVGVLTLTQIQPDILYRDLVWRLVTVGFGVGFTLSPLTAAGMDSAPPGQAGTVAALLNTSTRLGGALGVAMQGGIHIHTAAWMSAIALFTAASLSARYLPAVAKPPLATSPIKQTLTTKPP